MAASTQLDPDVVARARRGDPAALDEVVGFLERPIFNLAYRMLLDRTEAEDATQEALIKILTGLPSFEGRARLSTWAWTLACRTILDERRARARRPTITFAAFEADLAAGLELEAPDRPEDRVLLGQLKVGCARALLQCLDGDHRLAFVLGEIMELDGVEAAEISGVNPAAHRKRLSRARARLAEALGRQCGVVEPRAACRCHRRLTKAQALGRVSPDAADLGLDVASLAGWVGQLDTLADRASAFFRADPEEPVAPALRAQLRRIVREVAAGPARS